MTIVRDVNDLVGWGRLAGSGQSLSILAYRQTARPHLQRPLPLVNHGAHSGNHRPLIRELLTSRLVITSASLIQRSTRLTGVDR